MKNIIIVTLLLWTCSYTASDRIISNGNDPNTELDSLKLIKKAGYPAEAHIVLTEDGYLLEMHRIPGKPGAPTVYLQHGLIGTSADWIINAAQGKENSLVFLLADAGYDVWLGNIRGNTYSRGHVSLSTNDIAYWNFSWHELGVYDLPAMINYIVNMTGSPLKAYIGFSMGTTSLYVMASERPEITKLVQSSYSLAPVVFVKHIKGLFRVLATLSNDAKLLLYALGEGEFLQQNLIIKFIAKYFCYANYIEEKLCINIFFTLTGFDNSQFNYSMMPIIATHIPGGASSKMFMHYGQGIQSGYFRQFDYGEATNKLKYNNPEPPSYDVSKLKIPHTIFCASNDWLSRLDDVDQLISKLSIKPTVYKVPYEKFNHIDYLFANDVYKLVYEPLIRMINESK